MMDKIKTEYIKGNLKAVSVTESLNSGRLACHGHVIRRQDSHVTRRSMQIALTGRVGRGRPQKLWMN